MTLTEKIEKMAAHARARAQAAEQQAMTLERAVRSLKGLDKPGRKPRKL